MQSSSNQAKIRTHKSVNKQLDKTLFGYAAAASAAGVGLLALAAPPAEASVVFTKTNVVLASNTSLAIDLNNDGVTDVTIVNTFHIGGALNTGSSFIQHGFLYAQATQPGAGVVADSRFVLAFGAQKQIGPQNRFASGPIIAMERCNTPPDSSYPILSGPWGNGTNKFLGLKFAINGETHYGWVRINTSHSMCHLTATITGYAYETVPDKRIVTGQRIGSAEIATGGAGAHAATGLATLGLLATGASGLVAWRRE